MKCSLCASSPWDQGYEDYGPLACHQGAANADASATVSSSRRSNDMGVYVKHERPWIGNTEAEGLQEKE